MDYRIQVPDTAFNPPVYQCRRVTKPFTLDGNIFKPFWEDVPFTDLFRDIEGDKRSKPFYETRAKMQWDDENLYFAAVLHGKEIWATLTERDCVIFYDNDFEIFIDPDSDTHGYFEFEMNALNTVWDLFLTKPYRDRGGKPLDGWDIKGLQSAVHIKGSLNEVSEDNEYWSIEVVMPFQSLAEMSHAKLAPSIGDYYRINFSRVQWHTDVVDGKHVKQDRAEENWVWAPTGVVNIHYPELWGFVFFTEAGESYSIPEEEYTKWHLRRWYYAMHAFFDEEGYFTDDVSLLNQTVISHPAPTVEVTSRSFVLSQMTQSGDKEIVLFDDGKIEVVGIEDYEKRLRQLPESLLSTLSDSERECMIFLYDHMPLSDIADYSHDLILKFVRHGLKVKKLMPWGAMIRKNDFLNYVLQYRVNNEDVEYYCDCFFNELMPLIEGLTMEEAAITVNYWCFGKATYQATNSRTASPLTTVRNAFGRCGEESTFTVAALRSVGIPARQCYAPRWSHCDDNHAWVEVMTEDGWHFLGACEPEMALDRGWFRLPASKSMLIHNRVLSNLVIGECITKQTPKMTEINVLDRYADTKELSVQVIDHQFKPLEGAAVRFEVVNYSEFYPIAELKTDSEGCVSLMTGLGDLMVYVHKGDLAAYEKVSVGERDHLLIQLKEGVEISNLSESWIFEPPSGGVAEEVRLTAEQMDEHDLRIEKAVSERQNYQNSFYDEGNWEDRLVGFEGRRELVAKELIKARGNHSEIESFLKVRDSIDPYEFELNLKLDMLRVLPQKDLSDARSDILTDHFTYSYEFWKDYDQQLFTQYIMSPRIWIEKVTAYRCGISDYFDVAMKQTFKHNPITIKSWIDTHIRMYEDGEYLNLNTSPMGVLTSLGGNKVSHKILFVAIARTLGIPARLNQEDGSVEYYDRDKWYLVSDEAEGCKKSCGILQVTSSTGQALYYDNQFTIGRLKDGCYETLAYDSLDWAGDTLKLTLEVGHYRLVTANRHMNESNHVVTQHFCIREDETCYVTAVLADVKAEKAEIPLIQSHRTLAGDRSLLCWLAPGEEPTEHLLNEIIEHETTYNQVNTKMVLFIQDESLKQDPTLKRVLDAVPAIELAVDTEYDIQHYYSGLTMKEMRLPLALVTDNSNVNYGFSGYQVGIGRMISRSILVSVS